MSCPLFDEAGLSRCIAVYGDHVPTCHERERYCRTGNGWTACPTLLAYRAKGRPISEVAYYSIWCTPDDRAVLAKNEAPPYARAPDHNERR